LSGETRKENRKRKRKNALGNSANLEAKAYGILE